MTLDISNFYLMTPLKRPDYIRVKIDDIPEEIINEYNLQKIANIQGMVCIEVTKGMYGLPRQDSSRTNYSNNASTNMDTSRANWCPDYGNTQQDQ